MAELTEELYSILGNSLHPDGRPMTFAELAGVLERRVAERSAPEEPPGCPQCGREPISPADDEARVLQTDRGEVAWMESAYECRHPPAVSP